MRVCTGEVGNRSEVAERNRRTGVFFNERGLFLIDREGVVRHQIVQEIVEAYEKNKDSE